MKKVIQNANVRPPLPVLSPGILWKDFVFTLGMAGLDKNRKPVGKDLAKQTVRTMERLEEVLNAENLTFKEVVKTRFFLTNADDFEIVNRTFKERTGEDFPANTYTEVNRCPILGEDVKIQMIAHKREKRPVRSGKAPSMIPGSPQAYAVEDLLFIQGLTGIDVKTGQSAGNIIGETEKTIENISHVLEADNLTLENLVKTTIFMTDTNEIDKVMQVYNTCIPFLSPFFMEVRRVSLRGERIKIESIASRRIGKRLVTDKVPAYTKGMAQGISTGEFIFVQGMGGIEPRSGRLVDKDILRQTEQTLENIEEVLKEGNMTLENVLDASIFLTDMEQYTRINAIYAKFMGSQPPARICVEVPRLPSGCDIMIEVMAAA